MPELKRPRAAMPAAVDRALRQRGAVTAFKQRPAYQRNDYLRWIAQAKQPETQRKRLAQMLDELKAGGVYMKMKHAASAKKAAKRGR